MTTATRLPYMFGEMPSIKPWNANCTESGSNFVNDGKGARKSIAMLTDVGGADLLVWPQASVLYGEARHWYDDPFVPSQGTNTMIWQLYNGATCIAQILNIEGGDIVHINYQLQTLQGGVMTAVQNARVATNHINCLGWYLKGGAAGEAALYIESAPVDDPVTGLDHASWPGITTGKIGGGPKILFSAYWSEGWIDSVPHFGARVKSYNLDTDGFHQDLTGSHTDINDGNDATTVFGGSADMISGWKDSAVDLDDYMHALGVYGRAKRGASGPQGAKIGVRTPDGSDHFGDPVTQNVGFLPNGWSWRNNPHTGLPWTLADGADAEGEVETVT